MAKLPPDDNKVDPEVAAPCLIKFTQPGGRRPVDPPNISIPPVGPGGGTGPPGGGGRTGATGPGRPGLGYCHCFFEKSTLKIQAITPPALHYKKCELWTFTWKQTCEQTNAAGEYKGRPGEFDPFGGMADINAKRAACGRGQVPLNRPGWYIVKPCKWDAWLGWGVPEDCRDALTGKCVGKCKVMTMTFTICTLRDVPPPGIIPPTTLPVDTNCDCSAITYGGSGYRSYPPDPEGCVTHHAIFKYICAEFEKGIPKPPDPAEEFLKAKIKEGGRGVHIRIGTVSNPCAKTNCGGKCPKKTVVWKTCPPPISAGPTTGTGYGWQCIDYATIQCTGPGETTIKSGVERKCVPCDKDTPKHLCKTNHMCKRTCKDTPPECRKDTPVGGSEVEEGLIKSPEGDDSIWRNRNNPGKSTMAKPDPKVYSLDVQSRSGNIPFIANSIIPYIPSVYNRDYVFHNWTDLDFLRNATLTALKNAGDKNSIFRVGQINKVLNDCIIPFNTINTNIYNDKTISILIHAGHGLVNESLSEETVEALELVEKSNLVSVNLSLDLRKVIYSSVISGNLDLYSPQLLKEISDVGERVLGSTIPSVTNSPPLDFTNAMTYITRNLNSLYPKSYGTNGDDSRFAAHWLALPPEYQLALGVTPQVGDPVGIKVSLNFDFPVYERDGTKRVVKEFLDFFEVIAKDGVERTVPLKSNRSNLYTLDRNKESRLLGLIDDIPEDKITTRFTVYSGDNLATVSSIETNDSPVTLEESYLLKIDLDSIKIGGITDAGLKGNFMRSYTATYDTSWVGGEPEEQFNSVINSPKPVCGPNWVVYLPQDPWWGYFVDAEASNLSLSATFNCLDVDGYLPGMPDAIIASQIPYTLLLVPTKDKVYKNPLNGNSFYTSSLSFFTTTVSPFKESDIYTKPTKNTTEINLQGQHDEFAMKFAKDFSEADLSAASVTDAADYTTCASDFGKCIIRINDLKDRYNLKFEGTDTLTQFDLYKGFSLNQLLKLLSIDLKDVFTITGVNIILNKTRDRETPNSFITEDRLLPGQTPNTTNYIGGEILPQILYFPPEYDYYN